jgi:hypothetical protein
MPIYVYREILEDGSQGEIFEVEQSMKDATLTVHPVSGLPVKRVIQAPNINARHTPGKNKSMLENKNVERLGFTKYEKDRSTGNYYKTVGKDSRAPDVLNTGHLKNEL